MMKINPIPNPYMLNQTSEKNVVEHDVKSSRQTTDDKICHLGIPRLKSISQAHNLPTIAFVLNWDLKKSFQRYFLS